jgi:hypothetical protein
MYRYDNETDSELLDRILKKDAEYPKLDDMCLTIVDIVDDDDRYIVHAHEKQPISCRQLIHHVDELLKSELTTEQLLRVKDKQIRLLSERVEQAEFDSLCYKLLYSSDQERVDLLLMQETDDTVTIDVKHNSAHYYGRTVKSRHTFHKSYLREEQQRKLPTLELRCKMRLLEVGEMCRDTIEDYINRLRQDEEAGNIRLMERTEDHKTIWIDIQVKHVKRTYITSLTYAFDKDRLTSKQFQLFRSIPLRLRRQ